MLAPKKVKYRKMMKGRRKGTAWRGSGLAFGDFGLQATERGWLTARQEQQPPHRWIVWADGAEVARLRALHQRPAGYATRRRWVDEETDEQATAGDQQTNNGSRGRALSPDETVG